MSSKNQKLSTESYKGTRDFYPEDQAVQNYIFSTMRRVVESFGYVEYGASILEDTEIYRAKSGSEIVNEQTYTFTDRGGRDVTIRPEMTPTVARMVAGKRQELAFPLRWYSIPNLFRYERPQRGRLREHWQLNCDIFGVDSIEADAEIITVAYNIMKAFGAKDGDFEIRVSSRKILNAWAKDAGLNQKQVFDITKLLDKYDKMSKDEFETKSVEIIGKDKWPEFLKLIQSKTFSAVNLKGEEGLKAQDELVRLSDTLTKKGVNNHTGNLTLARGFDYYTGIVFEVFDTSQENNRSLFGGGRYDDLVSIFGVEKVSGVGFGMGDVTIKDFLETHKLLPKLESTTKVYICVLADYQVSGIRYQVSEAIEELAKYLRENDVNVAVDYTGRKLDKQIKTAEKQGIPYIICVGSEEAASKKFKVKNLEKREEVQTTWEGLLSHLGH